MSSSPSSSPRPLSSWHPWLATVGGIGLIPWAPGTFGSLPGLWLGIVLWRWQSAWTMAGYSVMLTWVAVMTVLTVLTWVSVHAIEETEHRWQCHDPGSIVIDEVVGQAVTILFLPQLTAIHVISGFVAFRLFDILKPWPIRWLDTHVKGGWGTMVDDVVAGLLAGVTCLLVL